MYTWTEELEVGIETIDSQHREMFRAFNALLGDPERPDSAIPGEVPWMIGFLEDYVVNHFGMEELYMRRYNYPGYAEHKAEHSRFISMFYDLRDEVDAEGITPAAAQRIAAAVGDWLVGHIGVTDRELGKFLKEKNRK
jgi:hemerythrin-like metal-binding protein